MAPQCTQAELQAACAQASMSTADIQQQSRMGDILRMHGVSPGKLNGLLDAAKLRAEEMKLWREIEAATLKSEWVDARRTADAAPDRESEAEKAYIVFTQGESAYTAMLEKRYGKDAAAWAKDAVKRKESFIADLFSLLQDYASMYVALPRLEELAGLREREEEALLLAIEERTGDAHADDRRLVYEVKAQETLGTYRTVFIVLLYLVLLVFILKGDWLAAKRYSQWWFWAALAAYGASPWLVYPISKKLFWLGAWIKHKWSDRDGRNVALSY